MLDSSISADYAANFTWSVLTALGAPVNVPSLTLKSILIPGLNESNAITFPFSVIGGIFSPGKAYIFQLTASSTGVTANTTFSQITLTANSAPTSGRIISSPTNGSALVTQFTVSSPGWTTDASSFPLSYAFSYRMFGTSINLTIAGTSLRPYTTTMLPAGVIILQTQVTDIYLTLAAATTNVFVTPAPALSFVSQILNTSLATAFAAGNINLAIQTVNNVSILHLSGPTLLVDANDIFKIARRRSLREPPRMLRWNSHQSINLAVGLKMNFNSLNIFFQTKFSILRLPQA